MPLDVRKCAVCHHEWVRREGYPEPRRCPNPKCRSMKWNQCDPSGRLTRGEAKAIVTAAIEADNELTGAVRDTVMVPFEEI